MTLLSRIYLTLFFFSENSCLEFYEKKIEKQERKKSKCREMRSLFRSSFSRQNRLIFSFVFSESLGQGKVVGTRPHSFPSFKTLPIGIGTTSTARVRSINLPLSLLVDLFVSSSKNKKMISFIFFLEQNRKHLDQSCNQPTNHRPIPE